MLKSLSLLGVFAIAILACGQTISLDDRSCPCESGWTCCPGSNVCAPEGTCLATLCPKGINLPPENTSSDAGADGKPVPLSAYTLNFLTSEPVSFDWATTAWPLPNGSVSQFGWIVEAQSGQSFNFKINGMDGAGNSTTPLDLSVYGPISQFDDIQGAANNTPCAVSGGAASLGAQGTWTASAAGMYLATPYHKIMVSTDGTLSVDGVDSPIQNAQLIMTPTN